MRLTSQSKEIISNVFNYFEEINKRTKGGQGAFERTIKATGIKKDSLSTILREKWSTDDHTFESPSKRYKSSRVRVITDSFDRETIRRKKYEIYEQKEHVTLSSLLIKLVASVRSWQSYDGVFIQEAGQQEVLL